MNPDDEGLQEENPNKFQNKIVTDKKRIINLLKQYKNEVNKFIENEINNDMNGTSLLNYGLVNPTEIIEEEMKVSELPEEGSRGGVVE